MRLNTLNLRKYYKLFSSVKVTGNAYYDHVFLDFRNKTMSFYTESTSVRTDLNLDGEKDIDYLYVDGLKFFLLVNTYDTLDIKKGKFYSDKKDKFSLPVIDEDLSITLDEDYTGDIKRLHFTDDLLFDLDICKELLEKSGEFPALFFDRKSILALSSSKCIKAPTNFDDDVSFSMPTPVLRSILSLDIKKDSDIEFRTKEAENGGQIIEFNFNDLFYRFTSSSDLELPVDPTDADFIDSYNHKNYFNVNTSSLMNALKIISSFTKIDLGHCEIIFESEDYIKIKLISDSEIEYKVEINSYTDFNFFKGKSFWVPLMGLTSAVSSLQKKKNEVVQIHYAEDKPTIMLSSLEGEDKMFVIQTLIQSPTE